jgi:hypothetical protein
MSINQCVILIISIFPIAQSVGLKLQSGPKAYQFIPGTSDLTYPEVPVSWPPEAF